MDQVGQVSQGDQLHQMVFFLVVQLYQGFPRCQASHHQVDQRGLQDYQGLGLQVDQGPQQGNHLATCHLQELSQLHLAF